MITINNLEVRFDVEGEGREEFERLFKAAMCRWEAETAHRREREKRARHDSSLGDRHYEGGQS